MTMVTACSFMNGAVIISDSRATWKSSDKNLSDDSLQKIVSISPRISLSYSGSVYLASKVIQHIRKKAKTTKGYQYVRKISSEMPRVAKYYFNAFPEHAKYGLSLILAGVDASGNILVCCYCSPDFRVSKICNGFTIIGSGEVARPYLEENFAKINSEQNTLKQKADILSRGLDSALGHYEAKFVGGLFQVILISSEGIVPLERYSLRIDPVRSPNYLGMRMEKGRWIQEVAGGKTLLMEPHELSKVGPREKRIYEYFPKKNEQKLSYYLSYFITCLKVERSYGDTAFLGIVSQIGSHKYPCTLSFIASLGFWGPAGDRELQFRVDYGNENIIINSQKVGDWYFPEKFEIDVPLEIEAKNPGPIFLDCIIDGNLLARKALYFSDLRAEQPPKSKEEIAAKYEVLSKRMPEEHGRCSDLPVEKGEVFLDYFMLCHHGVSFEKMTIKVRGEARAIYWKSYPLSLKLFLASSFRLKPGKHFLEIKIKYAPTGEEHQIAKCEIDNNSSCISVPVYADDLIVQIPKEGIYYVNSYVDGKFVGCVLLFAETDKPIFSYSLQPKDLEQISSGKLFILLARSQEKNNASNLGASN